MKEDLLMERWSRRIRGGIRCVRVEREDEGGIQVREEIRGEIPLS